MSGPRGLELLTTGEMAEADRLAVASGVPSLSLMENAGRAVADAAVGLMPRGSRAHVLCGPGNNGGDGFVAARLLREQGYSVRLHLLGAADDLKGDAAVMAARWGGTIEPLSAFDASAPGIVIDALFGAGLARALEGPAAAAVEVVNARGWPVLSVDVPSGLDGTTGASAGPVVRAWRTVTFFRRKPGHVLLPGRALCGEVVLAQIGIPDKVLEAIAPQTYVDAPALWRSAFPSPRAGDHKYTRGHALVMSGPARQTGAARMAARGALRIGAGLVTVGASAGALAINAAHLTAIMLAEIGSAKGLAEALEDTRMNAVAIGPGCGVGQETADLVLAALASPAAVVLDADALTSFASGGEGRAGMGFGFTAGLAAGGAPGKDDLFHAIAARPAGVVMTPHEGEFKRLFPDLTGSKLERARGAAKISGATIVLKGADTLIAAPDGRAAINENAPPTLATAGSGDVLAGFITGLLAQGMPVFEGACAAVWLHGECANVFGPGLIAEDLPEGLPRVLASLPKSAA